MRVLEIFASLQGEGVWAGTPMTFVRLAGCNAAAAGLECVRWCDTKRSWDAEAGEELTAAEVAARVHLPRVCVTGGEPLLQANGLAELVALLHARDVQVHLETNGTLPLPPGETPDWVTVSPKPPAFALAPGLRRIDEIKVVVDADLRPETVEALAAAHPEAQISLQPEAGAAPVSTERAVALVLAHPRWRLSLQIHKLLGLR
ncbi:MAG: radical SAM protein [Thermoleophilia bacterium]